MIDSAEFQRFLLEEKERITEEPFAGTEIDESTSLKDELGLDSLALLELCLVINQKYGTDISDRHTEYLSTVGDLIRVANETLPGKQFERGHSC
ncbi:acyl carrier protein [Corynebacterium pseudodiphtheriticum]|uniref:acyl carrier protein n=1 Tax=Corynebacterium pseudodiphtheriticum TaxID=37637 RepID=UPI0020BE1FEB|nr:acyl carrier protein [Corynebacterium pseudodiphtheriticum]UQV56153.1 acyl carrier protein [Corynebacterium pseudodiphtheriticum]